MKLRFFSLDGRDASAQSHNLHTRSARLPVESSSSVPAQWGPRSLGNPTTHLLTPNSVRAAGNDKDLAAQFFTLGLICGILFCGLCAVVVIKGLAANAGEDTRPVQHYRALKARPLEYPD